MPDRDVARQRRPERSRNSGGVAVDAVTALAERGLGPDADGYRREFVGLVRRSKERAVR